MSNEPEELLNPTSTLDNGFDSTPQRLDKELSQDSELGITPATLERMEQQGLVTALLFASGEVLAAERLGNYFGLAPQDLELLMEETAAALRQLGLDVVSAAGGYKLVTAAQWDEALRTFYRQVRKSRLSRNALEILAVIAYEQPITRVKIDELRQANSESAVRTLLERRLITVAGREEGPGKPFKYKTTESFLELFGLSSLAELPPKPVNFDVLRGAGAADGEFDDGDEISSQD